MQKIFTTGQIAKLYGVATRTVNKWIDAGLLLSYRLPSSTDRRITRANLVRFLKQNHFPLGDIEMALRPILVVSPDPMLTQKLFGAILADPGSAQLLYARNSFEAGVVWASLTPGVVLVDFSIGRAEALSMARHLAASDQPPWLVGLVNEDEDDMPAVEAAGFDDVHSHPAHVGLLAANLLGALADRAA